MGKILGGIAAAIIGLMVMAGLGSVSGGGKFDYATATEERQQKYLDNVAKGFSTGFKISAGKSATLTRLDADASIDMISVTIQYNDESIENASGVRIAMQKKWMHKKTCQMAHKQKLLEKGVTMRMRLKRPSGSQMTGFDINTADCALYIS